MVLVTPQMVYMTPLLERINWNTAHNAVWHNTEPRLLLNLKMAVKPLQQSTLALQTPRHNGHCDDRVAKSQAKINCRRLTDINSWCYFFLLMRTLTWAPYSVYTIKGIGCISYLLAMANSSQQQLLSFIIFIYKFSRLISIYTFP